MIYKVVLSIDAVQQMTLLFLIYTKLIRKPDQPLHISKGCARVRITSRDSRILSVAALTHILFTDSAGSRCLQGTQKLEWTGIALGFAGIARCEGECTGEFGVQIDQWVKSSSNVTLSFAASCKNVRLIFRREDVSQDRILEISSHLDF